MAENLTPKKYIDDSNMKQILTAIKSKTPVGGEYVTEEQLLAKDYATKTYVGEQIVNAEHLKREIVTVLPSDTEASDNVIYMLKVESATGNDKYQEYMKIDGTVQMIGDTSVDLTDYAKTVDIPTTLPANGGNADTVNNHTVESDVPENAVFTDTIYDDTEVKESIAKLNDSLVNKQDFRIFKSLEEFNEKKGTSLTVVSGIDNMKDIVNAMSNGEMLVITIIYYSDSDVYFGLNTSTGWTKFFTFIKANGICDVECRTTVPLTFKRVLNVDGVIGDWQELATMDKIAHDVDTSYMSNGVLNISSIRQSLGIGCYEIMGQGSSGHGSIRLNIWQVESGSVAFSCCITDFNGVRSICSNEYNSPTVDVGNSYFSTANKIIKVF